MSAMYVTSRLAAMTAAICLATAPALAETSIGFGTGANADTAVVTGVNFSINRVFEYDVETGAQLTSVPPRTEIGSIYITRAADDMSAAFIKAIANGVPFGNVTVRFDNGDTWLLTDAMINNYSSFADDTGGQTESFDLSFSKAEMKIGKQTIQLKSAG